MFSVIFEVHPRPEQWDAYLGNAPCRSLSTELSTFTKAALTGIGGLGLKPARDDTELCDPGEWSSD